MIIELVKNHIEINIKSEKLKFGENLFLNHYPDNPDMIVSVIDNGGYPPSLYVPTREKVVEFKLRAKTYQQAEKLGNEILNLFHDEENYNLGETRILHSYARTDVSYLYKDDNEREEFSLELVFLMQRK